VGLEGKIMHYLFGFSGRINRAKMWLFILVTLAWEIVIGLVAVFGLKWTVTEHVASWSQVGPTGGTAVSTVMRLPHLDPITSPVAWAAVGIIAVLILLYVVSLLAVYTKRLHDRNKSAWWLLPFLVIPWGLGVLQFAALPMLLDMGQYFGPLGLGWGAAHLIGTILGLWAFIELFFFRGTAGENPYGPDPLAK
jgi:uncharacterized membrane protein YhaH (DUF805 family)